MAAGAKGIRAGGAFVELGVDDRIAAGLNKAAKKLKAFGSFISTVGVELAGIGTAVLGPLGTAAQVFNVMGSALHDASQRTGVAVEQLSALKFAAEQSGASLDDLEGGLKKMASAITDARNGSAQATQTLTKLGLSVAQLSSLKPDQQFELIADALSKVSDATTKASLAQDIFGKGGLTLLPLLADGAKGFAAMEKRARDLGIVMSTEDANAADTFGDSLHEIWTQLKVVTFQAGAAVAKALQPFAEATTKVLRMVIDWVKANGRLIVTVGAIAAAVTVAGTGLVALGVAISTVGTALGAIATVVTAVGAGLAALATPIGAVVVALGGLAAAFLTQTKTGAGALAWLGDRFNELWDVAKESFGGIADALAAGDIALAGKILWAGLKAIWFKGVGELKTIMAGLQIAWETIVHGMTTAWIEGFALMGKAVLALQSLQEQAIQKTAGAMTRVMVEHDVLEEMRAKQRKTGKGFTNEQFAAAVDARMAEAGKAADQINQKAQAGIDAQRAALEAQTNAELAAAEKLHQAKLANIGDEQSAGVKAAEEELRKAQEELAKLRGQAAGQRKSVDTSGGPAAAIGSALDGLNAKLSARGTFNAAAVQSLQSSPMQERIAKAAERTARNTGLLLNNGAGGLA